MASDPTVQEVLAEAFKAYRPLVDSLQLHTKITLYLAIHKLGADATNEILEFGLSLMSDKEVQEWIKSQQ